MIRAIGLAVLLVVAACGKKKEEAAAPGSAAPVEPAPAPLDAAAPVVVDAAMQATADAAVATVDPCSFATREEMQKITAGWTKDPEPVPVTASVLGGCTFELANRYVTIEAHPASERETLAGKGKAAKERGFPPQTMATSNAEAGDAYVSFEGKSYFLRVHADAGDRNPDVKLAVRLAQLLAKGAK